MGDVDEVDDKQVPKVVRMKVEEETMTTTSGATASANNKEQIKQTNPTANVDKTMEDTTTASLPVRSTTNNNEITITEENTAKITSHDNDILCITRESLQPLKINHMGNLFYKAFVYSLSQNFNISQNMYTDKETMSIVDEVIAKIEAQNPPGRFLIDHHVTNMNNNIDWKVMDRQAVKCKIQNDLKDAKVGYTNGSQHDLPKIVPHQNDVLSTGIDEKDHYGNYIYINLVASLSDKYCDTTNRQEKDSITEQLIEKIQAQTPSGRFLKKAGNGNWIVMDCSAIRSKIKTALRKRRERLKSSSLKYNVDQSTANQAQSATACTNNTAVAMTSNIMPPRTHIATTSIQPANPDSEATTNNMTLPYTNQTTPYLSVNQVVSHHHSSIRKEATIDINNTKTTMANRSQDTDDPSTLDANTDPIMDSGSRSASVTDANGDTNENATTMKDSVGANSRTAEYFGRSINKDNGSSETDTNGEANKNTRNMNERVVANNDTTSIVSSTNSENDKSESDNDSYDGTASDDAILERKRKKKSKYRKNKYREKRSITCRTSSSSSSRSSKRRRKRRHIDESIPNDTDVNAAIKYEDDAMSNTATTNLNEQHLNESTQKRCIRKLWELSRKNMISNDVRSWVLNDMISRKFIGQSSSMVEVAYEMLCFDANMDMADEDFAFQCRIIASKVANDEI